MNVDLSHSEDPTSQENNYDSSVVTVLLVEDEEPLRNVIVTALTSRGFNVMSASTPSAAMEAAMSFGRKIDVLLADVSLPEMDGYALAGKLVRAGLVRRVVYMSGYSEEPLHLPTVNGHRPLYIEKPFRLSVLVATITRALGD